MYLKFDVTDDGTMAMAIAIIGRLLWCSDLIVVHLFEKQTYYAVVVCFDVLWTVIQLNFIQ